MNKEPKQKEYIVQIRVVAIVGVKVKADSMTNALDIAKGYELGDFIKAKEIYDGSVRVVGVDDAWGDLE